MSPHNEGEGVGELAPCCKTKGGHRSKHATVGMVIG